MRIAAGVEYDGGGWCGWQTQKNGCSVQESIESGLRQVAAHPVRVIAAGRTDAGVHATGQVIHFDTPADRSERSWVLGVNSHLPPSVNLLWARRTAEDFHARFSARQRTYHYYILNRPIRSSLARGRAWWVHQRLDERAMMSGARWLIGEHDFSSFRAAACQSHTAERHISSIDVQRRGDLIRVEISANAFLHHMVRNIVGMLARIGRGEAPQEWAREVLRARDRTKAGVTAPPAGLYLTSVSYPAEYGLPEPEPPATGMLVTA